jgi:hypothetical protein
MARKNGIYSYSNSVCEIGWDGGKESVKVDIGTRWSRIKSIVTSPRLQSIAIKCNHLQSIAIQLASFGMAGAVIHSDYPPLAGNSIIDLANTGLIP